MQINSYFISDIQLSYSYLFFLSRNSIFFVWKTHAYHLCVLPVGFVIFIIMFPCVLVSVLLFSALYAAQFKSAYKFAFHQKKYNSYKKQQQLDGGYNFEYILCLGSWQKSYE